MTDRLEKTSPLQASPDELTNKLFASAYLPPNRLQNAARVDGPLIAIPTSMFSSYALEQATAKEFRALTTQLGWKVAEGGLADPWRGVTRSMTQETMRDQLLLMREKGLLQGTAEQQMLSKMSRRGVLKGFAAAGLAVGANIAMDQLIFKDDKYGTFSAISDGIALPGLALAPLPWHLKGALMVGSHSVGRLIDRHR